MTVFLFASFVEPLEAIRKHLLHLYNAVHTITGWPKQIDTLNFSDCSLKIIRVGRSGKHFIF